MQMTLVANDEAEVYSSGDHRSRGVSREGHESRQGVRPLRAVHWYVDCFRKQVAGVASHTNLVKK
jgi:hypothetical protein